MHSALESSDLRIVTVPQDVIKNRVPEDVYDKVLSDLERKKTKTSNKPITFVCFVRIRNFIPLN